MRAAKLAGAAEARQGVDQQRLELQREQEKRLQQLQTQEQQVGLATSAGTRQCHLCR